jgi:hypothetical protein
VPGRVVDATVVMDTIAHRFEAGSRLRLALAPCSWPLAWPSPEPVTLDVRHGTGAALVLPVRPPRAADAELRQPDPPAEPEPLPVETLHPGSGGARRITRDLASGTAELLFDWDCGGLTRLPNGVLYEDTSVATYRIADDDPLSARVRVENTSTGGRDGARVEIRATGEMTCDAEAFAVTSTLEVHEEGRPVFARTWEHRFPRDHC